MILTRVGSIHSDLKMFENKNESVAEVDRDNDSWAMQNRLKSKFLL